VSERDRNDIIDVVDAIFDTTDTKAWDTTERLFTEQVGVDFTSLAGGEPATIGRAELVNGWRVGLHPRKKSFHLVSHYRVEIDGDTARVGLKGYTHNVLDEELGGGMWEVWGTYDIPLARTDEGWRASGLAFHATHTRGDLAVRTHTLPVSGKPETGSVGIHPSGE
jgi:hypothetical protein